MKTNSAIGITGGSNYSTLLGIRGWSDSSGGPAHELAFDSSGRIGHRYGLTTDWSAWKTLIESDDSRLTNARPPTQHEHQAEDIRDLDYYIRSISPSGARPASSIDTTILGASTPSASTFLAGDRRWKSIAFSALTGKADESQIPLAANSSKLGGQAASYYQPASTAMTTSHTANAITSTNIINWNSAYTHSTATGNPHGLTLSNLGLTATATELNYTDGVTSNIQTQLNGKAAKSHGHTWAEVTNKPALHRQVSFVGGALVVEAI